MQPFIIFCMIKKGKNYVGLPVVNFELRRLDRLSFVAGTDGITGKTEEDNKFS